LATDDCVEVKRARRHPETLVRKWVVDPMRPRPAALQSVISTPRNDNGGAKSRSPRLYEGDTVPAAVLDRTDPEAQVDARSRGGPVIDDVVDHLMTEFDGILPANRVRDVVVIGRRDLVGEVPPEALPEFLHRLARQRLSDLRADGQVGHPHA